jgi:hypothetical protein
MAYIRIKGIPGLVYEPDSTPTERKHDCDDCYACQWCGDTRCTCCLRQKKGKVRPPSEEH